MQKHDLNYTAKLEENLILICNISEKIIAVDNFPPPFNRILKMECSYIMDI